MTDYRKILMLRSKGCSQREMERSKVASREKTKEVYEAADRLGLSWPLDDDITNEYAARNGACRPLRRCKQTGKMVHCHRCHGAVAVSQLK